ncbi:MAG: hypothetical protein KAT71_02055 [Gammaproteobacteria bacterium]|nr:hypothetical protein [Gammaproteobacteria bacterium]
MYDIIEVATSIALFANAFFFLPQLLMLIKAKNAKNLSLLTFMGFNIIQVFFIIHGIIQHDLILILGYILALSMCGSITYLILYYRHREQKGG